MVTVLIFKEDPVKQVKKEEEKLPKYIVPTSNFQMGENDSARILGVPCQVLSETPYKAVRKHICFGDKLEDVIDVKSLLTGITYTIPTGWYNGYDNPLVAIRHSEFKGSDIIFRTNQDTKSLIGSNYYPKDNSYISDFNGKYTQLYGKTCKVVSIPFKGVVNPCGKDIIETFILVEYNGAIYRTLFGEWNFYPKG